VQHVNDNRRAGGMGGAVAIGSGFAVRLSCFFGAIFAVYGIQLPFLPAWLETRGLSPAEIGLATSLPLLVRIATTPAIGLAADRYDVHRELTIWAAALSLLVAFALPFAGAPVLIAALVSLFLVLNSAVLPLADTIAMKGVSRGGLDYGRMRLWGSIAFIVTNVAGGAAMAAGGGEVVALLLVAGASATLVAAFALPRTGGAGDTVAGAVATSRHGWSELRALASCRPLLVLLVAAGAIQASHALVYGFGVIHWRRQGIDGTLIGVLWALGVVIEVALFWVSGEAVQRLAARRLMLIGGGGAALRWVIMAVDPPLALLAVAQALHAVSFAVTHIASVHLLRVLVADRQSGTAQALLATATGGIGMGLALMASGPIYAAFAGAGYLAMAVLAAAGTAVALTLPASLQAGRRA
jgi:PPP family 3-phenylpropionic acid transporter